jgi:hypothetical protein
MTLALFRNVRRLIPDFQIVFLSIQSNFKLFYFNIYLIQTSKFTENQNVKNIAIKQA